VPDANANGSGSAKLSVEALSVRLGEREVLHRVNLEIRAGELVTLVGPNGAGKTTLLRSILGLVHADRGHVLIDGAPVVRARRRIGYVPQRHEFAWEFPVSVREAVMSGRTRAIGWLHRPARADHQAVADALDRAGISDLAGRPVGELSGGQRQRVLVARGLVLTPSVLLLDEPFAGVDVPTQELLSDLLSALAASGQAVLMTTHDLNAAVRSSQRLVLLNRTVVADGPPGELADPALWLRAFGVDLPSRLPAFARGRT
jgi:manganese/iron transport system ATP-binding protein